MGSRCLSWRGSLSPSIGGQRCLLPDPCLAEEHASPGRRKVNFLYSSGCDSFLYSSYHCRCVKGVGSVHIVTLASHRGSSSPSTGGQRCLLSDSLISRGASVPKPQEGLVWFGLRLISVQLVPLQALVARQALSMS